MMVIDLDAPGKFKRLAYPGPRFVAREAEELTDVEDVAGHFVDLMAASSSAAEKATQILQEAQPRGIKVHFVAAAQASKVRMDVEVEPGRLPSVELLCDKYVESAGDTLDPKLLRQLAQESLHAADTEG